MVPLEPHLLDHVSGGLEGKFNCLFSHRRYPAQKAEQSISKDEYFEDRGAVQGVQNSTFSKSANSGSPRGLLL